MLRTPCLFPTRLTFLISGVTGKGGRKEEQACLSGTQPPPELASVPQWALCLWSLGSAAATLTLASGGRSALFPDHAGLPVVISPLFFTSSDWDYSKGIWAGN